MGKGLENAIAHINKQYGEGSIMQGTEMSLDVSVVSTGCLSIDLATGVGGIPRARSTEIFGKPGSGKTTLALQIVAQGQKQGLRAAYIDVEHALDPSYAIALGVDLDTMLISQPSNAEEALEIVEIVLRSGEVGIVVIDSVDALVPKAVIDGEMGDKHVALLARLMSQAMRKLTALVNQADAVLLFINQTRTDLQIMGYGGSKEVTSGGTALRYYTSMRIEVKYIGQLKDDDARKGSRTKVNIIKNKVASPYKEAEVDLIFGKGFARENDLLQLAIEHKVVKQSGAWYAYGDKRLGMGRGAALAALQEDASLCAEIRTAILNSFERK